MAFEGLPVLDEPTTEEEGGDDGWALYLFWRFVQWRRNHGLPDLNLDDPERVKQIVTELEELFGDLLLVLRSGVIPSPAGP
jgi:hypothetical protein